MKKIFSKELIIGVCAVVTLLILFFGINYLKGINLFHTSNYYYVSYTNVAELAQSAPVMLDGYKVGLVREIEYEYDNPGHILVELSLDSKLKVPRGSKAVITTDMLGTSSVMLQLADNTDYHSVGERLIGTTSPGLMDKLAGDLMPSVSEILPHVDSLIVAVTTLVSDPALTNSVRRLDNVMANLETSTQHLSAVMTQLQPIVTGAASTMDNVGRFSDELVKISADLAEVSTKLRQMPIDSTFNNINRITADLQEIMAQLNSDNSSLGLLMRDPGLYNNLNSSASHIDSILIDLKRDPKRYIPKIKVF